MLATATAAGTVDGVVTIVAGTEDEAETIARGTGTVDEAETMSLELTDSSARRHSPEFVPPASMVPVALLNANSCEASCCSLSPYSSLVLAPLVAHGDRTREVPLAC